MFLASVSRALVIGLAASFCASCAGTQPLGTGFQTDRSSPPGTKGKSWMLPEARQHTLLYISTAVAGVYVFDYPSRQIVGILNDASSPEGLCSDSAGNVFVTDSYGRQILEYSHGGNSPIRTLKGAAGPIDCAVDPKTGGLAVASETSAIYLFEKGRRWSRKYVNDPGASFWFCTYDSRGNLFAPTDLYGESVVSELPRGASSFTNIKLSKPIGLEGIQSHDGYLVAGDGKNSNIYQVRVSNSIAEIVHTTRLAGSTATRQFTFYRDKLISPDPASDFAGIWNYPAGGKPVLKIDGIPGEPIGSTISEP